MMLFLSRQGEVPRIRCFNSENKDGSQKNQNSEEMAKTEVGMQYTSVY